MLSFLRDPNRDTWFASKGLDAYRIDHHAIVCDLCVGMRNANARSGQPTAPYRF